MNNCIFIGRLTKDPEIRHSGEKNTCIAHFSLAVDRRYKKEGQTTADFFDFTAFGKLGEFVEKYLKKGSKIAVTSECRNNNYTNKDGKKVYAINFYATSIEFAESKKDGNTQESASEIGEEFIDLPENFEPPFN